MSDTNDRKNTSRYDIYQMVLSTPVSSKKAIYQYNVNSCCTSVTFKRLIAFKDKRGRNYTLVSYCRLELKVSANAIQDRNYKVYK